MLDVIDHTNHPSWTPINLRLGRENGAKTYSVDIVKFYAPVFEEIYGKSRKKVLLITVQNWNSHEAWKKYKKIFLFVHERGATEEIRKRKLEGLKKFKEFNTHAEVWFITWCPQHAEEIREAGLNAFFLPMAIDTEIFKPYAGNNGKKNRIIYYGNLIRPKVRPFNEIKRVLNRKGWIVDYISMNRLNGGYFKFSPKKCREILSRYTYGIAVGRAAQELSAMGLKVMCYAYGDVMMAETEEEAEKLMNQNNTSWGEGYSLDEFKNHIRVDEFQKLKPLHRDVRDVAKILKQKLLEIENKV